MATFDKLGITFHGAIAIFYSVCTYLDLQITTPGVFTFGGRWKYLTFLNLVSSLHVLNSYHDKVPILNVI